MKKRKTVWWWIRVVLLCGAMLWAAVLYRWSRQDDPRLYQYLNSSAGRAAAPLFRFAGSALSTPIADKTE